jgi:hypothetical protein
VHSSCGDWVRWGASYYVQNRTKQVSAWEIGRRLFAVLRIRLSSFAFSGRLRNIAPHAPSWGVIRATSRAKKRAKVEPAGRYPVRLPPLRRLRTLFSDGTRKGSTSVCVRRWCALEDRVAHPCGWPRPVFMHRSCARPKLEPAAMLGLRPQLAVCRSAQAQVQSFVGRAHWPVRLVRPVLEWRRRPTSPPRLHGAPALRCGED